jgi:hypothetical protein
MAAQDKYKKSKGGAGMKKKLKALKSNGYY